ncbi:hypothetical protein MGG_02900 [Pyricularia oryzae 70-15]|uniref:5'-3' DNA helicase ZGRF1-like N-terminal domain-containing protein n=2 Tax=Pyricularia oryzae TaxID=318829 RepID=G5EI54_PYRO7|nr:uncharacterized protein MGG_02900 [Pyricularia oryzae 70-15]EAQ71257.1 hypothetical protein MGCH7_ch7g664 [Pyricularia oryzae 70-15]EHA46082.1 hypothetical protein MGG_02900 [Pyricularia oryzae 70-15]
MASESATSSPAPHGTTAPVLEYICLFTKDLKKKQKKWQDGRLKFHTYNKKVMVYDERGYNVGYMHWRRDYDLADGEELELESGGTQVQVCECVGTQEQDISGLVDKRLQEREQRAIKVAARLQQSSSVGGSRPVVRQSPNDHFQLRQVPLNQLLGTPTGHHGRALVPSESPFEQRQRASNDETPRPAKRPRREPSPPAKSGYAQNLFGAKLHLSSQPSSSLWQRTPRPTAPAASNPQWKPTQVGQPVKKPEPARRNEPKTPAVVDLVDDDEDDETGENDNGIDAGIPETSARADMQSQQVRKAEKATKKRIAPVQASDIEATPPHARSLSRPVSKKPRLRESTPPSSPEIVELKSPPAALSKPPKPSARPQNVAMTKTRCRPPEPEPLPDPEIDPPEPLEDNLAEQPKQKTALRIKSRKKRGLMMLSSSNVEASSAPQPQENRKRSKEAAMKPQDTDAGSSRGSDRDLLTTKTKKQRGKKPAEQLARRPSPSPAVTDGSQDLSPVEQAHIEPSETQTKQRGKVRGLENESAANSASETNSASGARNDPVQFAAKSPIQKGGKRARARHIVLDEEDLDSNGVFESNSKAARDPKIGDVHPDVAGLLFDDDSDASNDWVPPPPTCQNLKKISKGKKKQETVKSSKASDCVREDSEPPAGQMRLEKLGRKSVKSREIIGWVFDQPPAITFGPRAALPIIASQLSRSPSPDPLPDDSVIENLHGPPMSPPNIANDIPTSSELAQLIETPAATSKRAPDPTVEKLPAGSLLKTVPDNTAKTTAYPVQETTLDVVAENAVPTSASKPIVEAATKTTPDPAPVISARPRITNPATRGRKAALRSDAQGKVPQHILPADTNLPPRKEVLQALATMMAASSNEAAALLPSQIEPTPAEPERPKIKMKLPGFAPAGASVGDVLGPWTREAYDLLGMGRPSR